MTKHNKTSKQVFLFIASCYFHTCGFRKGDDNFGIKGIVEIICYRDETNVENLIEEARDQWIE